MRKGKTDETDSALKDLCDDSIRKIRSAVENGLSFDEACSHIEIADADVRESVADNALKLLVAELHYGNGMPLKQLAMKLRLSLSRLMNARRV